MEQEEQGVSFGRVLKVAFKNWIRFAIVGVTVAVAGSCAFIFGYNSAKGQYESQFSYLAKDLNEAKYADGSDFYYSRIISQDNLNDVKASNEEFASINVDKMVEDSGVSIDRSVTKLSDNKNSYSYTLTVGKSYFSNIAQARKFINAIASIPLNEDKSLITIDKYNESLVAFDSSSTYEDQLSYLEGQANSLEKQYELMLASESLSSQAISLVQSNIIEINSIVGEKVSSSESETATSESSTASSSKRTIINQLRYELNQKGYVMSYESAQAKSFEYSIQALEAEKALNTQKISSLITEINKIDNNVTVSSIDAQISLLAQRNIEIQYEIDGITLMMANKDKDTGGASEDATYIAAKQAFANRLKDFRSSLSSCTESYVNLLKVIYIDNASVSYNGNIVSETNTISVAASIISSILIGVVVGAAVNLIVDRKKLHE